jgi:hypothetical protein
MICAAGTLTASRRFLGPCPSGAVRSFVVIRHPGPSSREQTILLRPTGQPTPNAAQLCSTANHAGQHITPAIHAVRSCRPFGGS